MKNKKIIAAKTPASTKVIMTEYVLPGHANVLGAIFGGQLMSWIDIAAAIAAARHAERTCVTASIDELHFLKPIKVGMVVNIEAQVTAVHRTSCEVRVLCSAENPRTQESFKVAQAFLTFVSVDDQGKPIPMPALDLKSSEEKRLQKEGMLRREQRIKFRETLG